jgi:hypothetical protein
VVLGFLSGAAAQSGDPIRIGMSLALTGAGASPAKVINTALLGASGLGRQNWDRSVERQRRTQTDFGGSKNG